MAVSGAATADTVAYVEAEVDGPEHFDVVYAKTMTMIDSEPEIDLAKLAAVSARALAQQGDRDEVMLEHGPRLPRLWEIAGLRCFRAPVAGT